MRQLGQKNKDGQRINEAHHDRSGDKPHKRANAQPAQANLNYSGQNRGGEKMAEPVVGN